MKKVCCLFLMVLVLLSFSGCSNIIETLQNYTDKTEENSTVLNAEDTEINPVTGSTNYTMTDDIYGFQISIDNVVYQFPMKVSELLSLGWDFDEDENPNEMLESSSYNLVWFKYRNDYKANLSITNFASSEQELSKCYVTGLEIDKYDWEISDGDISLAKNIKRGISTEADIINAYGSPTDTYDGDSIKQLTYSAGGWREVVLYVSKSENILERIKIMNIQKPENFVDTEVSDETPKYILEYKEPVSLGTDVKSGIVQIDNKLYQFPIPVNALMTNGWELQKQLSDETITGKSYAKVVLSKNGTSIDSSADNYESYEVPVKYGAFENLTFYDNDAGLVLPNGIFVGMKHEELKSKIQGQKYTVDKDEYSTDYIFEISQWEYSGTTKNNIRINVDNDKGTISFISISIEKEE